MTYAEMKIDPTFIAIRRRIFVMFMGRDGFPEALSNEEFDRLQSVDGVLPAYLRIQRTGSRFPLTRDTKENISLAFANAGNHASCEMRSA